MSWIRASLRADVRIPAQSVSPEQLVEASGAAGVRPEAFNLIDVVRLKGGWWKALCECGEGPAAFEEERAAWRWITDHRCPILDADSRPG